MTISESAEILAEILHGEKRDGASFREGAWSVATERPVAK